MFIFQGSIIANFLSRNRCQYRIPVYQRNYEWSKEQCKKLFEDIVNAAKRNNLHFCGSVVYQPLAPVKSIDQSIIIDGQQRLTTIYILIKALLDSAADESEKAAPSQALFNTDQFGQFTVDETSKLKLKPAKDNNSQLLDLIYGHFEKIDKGCEIYRNYDYFCDLIKEVQLNGTSAADIFRGISLLTVAVIQLDQNDNAQEIFERINSTGIPLSLADKIRNFVLMTDADQDRLYEKYWLKIERLLPKEQLSPFFTDYLNMKSDGFVKANEAYDVFKSVYRDNGYTNESMLVELYKYVTYYNAFLFGSAEYGENVNKLLADLQALKQTTVFLFLFKVFDDYHDGVINNAILEKILKFLLSYSVRRLICEIGSNSLHGLYKTLYSRVFADNENKRHYYDAIVCFFLNLTSRDAVPSYTDFSTALKKNNLYRKNALCKFLLVSIENSNKEQLKTDNLTIEHVMPQNKNLSTAWQKMLGDNWKEVQETYLHTLGNLTLTAYNSELGDKPFDEKKKALDEVNTKVTVLYKEIKCCVAWNAVSIEKRAAVLADKAIELFGFDEPEHIISFTDPRFCEYTCENPDDATYKIPAYYVLQGERVNVTSFSEMLRSVIKRIYNQNSLMIENMARNNETLFASSQNAMFSYDKEKVRYPFLIEGTDIYAGSGYSASTIIEIIRALLDKCDIDRSDFLYCARSGFGTSPVS